MSEHAFEDGADRPMIKLPAIDTEHIHIPEKRWFWTHAAWNCPFILEEK